MLAANDSRLRSAVRAGLAHSGGVSDSGGVSGSG